MTPYTVFEKEVRGLAQLFRKAPMARGPAPAELISGPGSPASRALSPGSLLGSALSPLPGSLLRTWQALAAHRLDECRDIVTPVVIRDLVAGLDVLDGPDLDRLLDEIDFRVRPA